MSVRPLITVAQRRARLQRRHLLDGTVGREATDVADAVVALHATVPSTVHLSVWARGGAPTPDVVETALYVDRSLVKQLVMRRTLFVMTRPVLADASGAVGARIAAAERTNMLRDLRRADGPADPEGWLTRARAAVLGELTDGSAYPAAELRTRLPEFDIAIMRDEGKRYGGPSPMLPRLLNLLAADGEVVRGPNGADWHRSRPAWTAMDDWLGEPPVRVDPAAGHTAMVERWLRRYGPGTEADLVWWLGTTKTAVRAALAALEVTEVDLGPSDPGAGAPESAAVGYLMADDVADVEPVEPRALLLPALDPTTMGWRERGFYLGDHTGELFDRNGNGGQTAWWDGRIVGGWVLREDGVHVIAVDELPPDAARALDRRAAELTDWLGAARPAPGFPSQLMTRHC